MKNLNVTYSFPTEEQYEAALDLLSDGLGYKLTVYDPKEKKLIDNPEAKDQFIVRKNLEYLKNLAQQVASRRAGAIAEQTTKKASDPVSVSHTIE